MIKIKFRTHNEIKKIAIDKKIEFVIKKVEEKHKVMKASNN